MNDVLFYTCIAGFVVGVLVHSFFGLDIHAAWLIFLIASSIFIYLPAIGKAKSETGLRFKYPFLAASCIVCLALGFIRYEYFFNSRGDPRLDSLVGENLRAEGIVVEEPEIRETGVRITLALTGISSQGPPAADPPLPSIKRSKVLATIPSYSKIAYGDFVRISGKLTLPEAFETDTGREFDYVSYLAKDKIFYLIDLPQFEVVSHHAGNIIKEKLLDLKSAFVGKIAEHVVSPESDLMAGLLVSGKQSLPVSTLDQFKRVGIVHIVALSGYNVSIVAETLGRALLFLPTTLGLVVGGVGIVGFTVMAGAGSTIVRASIMALLVISSKLLKRSYTVSRALLIAGVGMLIWNPMILVFDPSFQLSFLATVGIIFVSPIVERWVRFVPEMFKFRETVVATLATQLFVLPYLLYGSGQLNVVALPVNLLVLFFVPFTMLMGFLTGLLSFISGTLALPVSFVSYLFLHYDLTVVSLFSSLSFASVEVPHVSLILVCVTYAIYAWIMIRFHTNKKTAEPPQRSKPP